MTLLVDASVWFALERPGERYHEEVREIALDTDRPVGALDLTLYEIANAAVVKAHHPDLAARLIKVLLTRCGDRLVRAELELVDLAARIAVEHGLTAYDAAYVAAARRTGWTLVSADIKDLVARGLAVAPDAAV